MNWITISKKYPKAFDYLIDSVWLKRLSKLRDKRKLYKGHLMVSVIKDRDLYDFFDKNRIWIDIDVEFGEDFDYTIDVDGEGSEGIDEVYTTRVEAETSAFTKAFSILEDKQNENS